jgi:hypothetical protein
MDTNHPIGWRKASACIDWTPLLSQISRAKLDLRISCNWSLCVRKKHLINTILLQLKLIIPINTYLHWKSAQSFHFHTRIYRLIYFYAPVRPAIKFIYWWIKYINKLKIDFKNNFKKSLSIKNIPFFSLFFKIYT